MVCEPLPRSIHIWPRWSRNTSHRRRITLTPFLSQPFPLQWIVNPHEINPHDYQRSRRFRPRCEEIEQVFMIPFFVGMAILVRARFHTRRFTILFLSWVAGNRPCNLARVTAARTSSLFNEISPSASFHVVSLFPLLPLRLFRVHSFQTFSPG